MLDKCILVALAAALMPASADAQCRIAVAGTACVAMPQSSGPRPGPVNIGEVVERGEYSMLMNARYYGLPSARDGWIYMRIEEEIYRVDYRTHEVLERVTHKASRNW